MAGNLDITNGHAARMRFSRFRQQMEGIASTPRKPRTAVTHGKKIKRDKPKPKREKAPKQDIERAIKTEPRRDIEQMPEVGEIERVIKPEPREDPEIMPEPEEPIMHPAAFVKNEPLDEGYGDHGDIEWAPLQPSQYPAYRGAEAGYLSPQTLTVKKEPRLKMEPDWTV